ncbi:hypothetical protein Q5752_000177 [Cryptotrichosporon argae]
MPLKPLLKKLEVSQREEEAEVWENSRWLNRDNVPLPPSRRTWGTWSYMSYFVATGINVSGWSGASSLLSLGLSVGQTMALTVVANILIGLLYMLTGSLGSYWHVGFPIWNRMTWGTRASFFPLVNRIVLSFTWYATQAWFGGQCLKVFLGSMFPSIYTMKNTLPASDYMTNSDFLCFWLFAILSLPMLHIPPEFYRKPFVAVSAASTVTAFALLVWALAAAHGAGPLLSSGASTLIGVAPVTGSALAWAWFHGISSTIGGICAGILNQSDYTRFSETPRSPWLGQMTMPLIQGTITSLIGVICASSAVKLYPDAELIWTPYVLLQTIQENGGNGARAAVFFAALVFTVSQWGINIAGNAISGGIDLTSLFPKYLNIRRGAYLTAILVPAFCPWALLSGANTFIDVMSGYATFLGPITGLMVTDYFLVRKGKVRLSHLYFSSPDSIYFYNHGINWRAAVAWALGVGPVFPGFIASVSTLQLPDGAVYVYDLCYPLSFAISGLSYYLFCKISPPPGLGEVDEYDVYGTFGVAEKPVVDSAEQTRTPDFDDKDGAEKDLQVVVAEV